VDSLTEVKLWYPRTVVVLISLGRVLECLVSDASESVFVRRGEEMTE
jgi:hypothetical protein